MAADEGPFWRSCDASKTDPNIGNAPCSLAAPAEVSDFHLDRFEVTVGRFRKFVEAYDAWRNSGHPADGEGGDPHVAGTGWSAGLTPNLAQDAMALVGGVTACGATWTDSPGPGTETKPIDCVDWYEAAAFCTWDGGWLVTEAEASYAASGGSQARAYPWSNPPSSLTIDQTYANYSYGQTQRGPTDVGAFSPKGDGRWGQADLGGNVYEWVWDLFQPAFTSPCTDCVGDIPDSVEDRARRGGGFYGDATSVRSVELGEHVPTFRNANLGFRCAR